MALTVMPQGFTESFLFLTILKAYLDVIKSPRGSTLLQYVDSCFFTLLLASSQEDRLHLLKDIASKGIRLPNKNQFSPKSRFDI